MELVAEATPSALDGAGSKAFPALDLLRLSRRKVLVALTMAALLALGIFLRVSPSAGYEHLGMDEHGYMVFVKQIQTAGLWNYDAVMRVNVEHQYQLSKAVVPATRIGFLVPAAWCGEIFHLGPFRALRLVSALSSILLLLATAVIGYRNGGIERMLVVTTLMAVAPLQIAFAQRALIDGYFAFWAVLTAWFFWENLQAPRHRGWLIAYGVSLFVLVLTKENAAFVLASLIATGAVISFMRRRSPSLGLVVMSIAAPALAVLFLAMLLGGIGEWISFYRMFAAKSQSLPYAIKVQDGAWYRYLIDFALLSPCVLVLACGRIFQIDRTARADIFWAIFLGFSFVVMSSVRYGLSLRFAAYWDEPLRWLAASQLIILAHRSFSRRAIVCVAAAVIVLAAVDLSQYWRLFVRGKVYDPVSFQLLYASKLVK